MEFDVTVALLLSAAFTSAYVFMLLRNIFPFIKQAHRISLLKERSDMITASAEIIGIEERSIIGLKNDRCVLYIMRIRVENAGWSENSALFFVKKPTERTGEKITVLYSRDDSSEITTPNGHETSGAPTMFARLALSVLIAFGIIFPVFYCFCKFGLPDD
ncbi:MAG: hypothetical protein NC299_01475 [Lachnospiraceae bacterium]|nr:hypothetical protein [Ruminococcus sp.]MCM1274020.1 hypothetical protein [Lachnospiraceae bacterium]